MNRQEFLQQLESCLTNMEPEAISEILADFNVFFEEALMAGKREDQICHELGDPAEISERIREEAVIFGSNSAAVADSDIQGADLSIALYSMSLICSQYDGSDCKVSVTKAGRPVDDDTIIITKGNGGLDIRQTRPDSFVKRFWNAFDHKTVHVSVPKNFKGNVFVKMARGNVTVQSLSAKRFKTELISGNIKINALTSDAGEIRSTSGNIHMIGCNVPVAVTGRSGNINISSHTGTVSASTLSGNNYVETDCISMPVKIETKSGNMRVKISQLKANLAISGQSGNISLSVEVLAANVDAKTKSGNIMAYFSPDVKAVFSAASSEFKNDFQNAGLEQTEIPVVNLYTKSGLVKVKKL